MASSSPIAGGPSQGFGRDSVASAKNHQIGHGAAMGYSSMHPASSRKAGRSVETGARRPAVATITPAPPVNGVVGERVARRGVKGGGPATNPPSRPRQVDWPHLDRRPGDGVAALGQVFGRRRSWNWREPPPAWASMAGKPWTFASTVTEIARDQFGPVIWISRETGRDARINHRLLRGPLAPPRILTGRRDTWPPERRQYGDSSRAACGFA